MGDKVGGWEGLGVPLLPWCVGAGACDWWEGKSGKLFTLEFDRLRKSMSVGVKGRREGEVQLLVKVSFIQSDPKLPAVRNTCGLRFKV